MERLFSIVTSFYGESPEYVYQLYSGIAGQRVNWEWIVTEDFSDNPETKQALELLALSDKRIKIIEQTEKMELFRDPSKYASGEFIFHIDADDQVHPNYLLHCTEWFDRFPRVNCILSGGYFQQEGGKFSRYVIHKQANLDILQSYVGRVWRADYKFEWDEIFSKPKDVIRMNDMFIVKSLECKGDILCIPRTYIKYTMRSTSNSSISRTPEEREKIERCESEFNEWYSKNKRPYPYDSFFFEIEEYLLGFLAIEWDDIGYTLQYLGKTPPPHKQRKIRELFPDFKIYFGDLHDGVTKPDFQIIDCTSGISRNTVNGEKTIVVCNLSDEETFNHYKEKFIREGRIFRWIKLWDQRWMITLN